MASTNRWNLGERSSGDARPFRDEVDEVVCAITPEPMRAVGLWYEDFCQTTDDEVRELLERAASRRRRSVGRCAA